MPFDEEVDETLTASDAKPSLKKISSQKSIFEGASKKPSQEDLEKNVKLMQDKSSAYKLRASELVAQFSKFMQDKTLAQNKNVFAKELEKEVLQKMVDLAIEINNDPQEQEGMGSLSWIVLLLKFCFSQRDKLNKIEYSFSQMEKKLDSISKELKSALDSKKVSE